MWQDMINPNWGKGEVMVLKRGIMMLTLLTCLALVSPGLAGQGNSKIMAAVKTVMEQHSQAFNAQDLKGVMTLYASNPNTVLMGTGPGEAYVGDEAIGGAYDQLFTRFEANTVSSKYDWIAVGSKGNFAWFAVTTTMETTVNKEKKERAFNMSGTLLKEKGKWLILIMHFSRLGAEEQPAVEPTK
jgi:ketosteroid isomerase-like protein